MRGREGRVLFHCFTLFANFPGGGRCFCCCFVFFVWLGVGFCVFWLVSVCFHGKFCRQFDFDLPQFQLLTDNVLYSSGNAGKKKERNNS